MIVVVLTACPPKLRGDLTRWLVEISAGIYVGHCTARVRELLWGRIVEHVGRGKALMVHSIRGEQRLSFRVHQHEWEPADLDGVTLMRRPHSSEKVKRSGTLKPGMRPPENWSVAGRRRRFKTVVEKRRDDTE